MEKLKKIIDSGNREEALNYVMNRLSNKEINVIDLYEKEILPVLRNLECLLDDKNICIWISCVAIFIAVYSAVTKLA